MSSKSVVVLPFVGAVCGLLSSCGQTPLSKGTSTSSSGTSSTSNDNVYTFSFSDNPVLQNVGGSIHTTIQAKSGAKDIYITRVSSSVATAVSTVCTHLGCTIGAYNSSTQKFTCPCHLSVFNSDGTVDQGPAVSPLPAYTTALTDTGIEVTVA